MFGIWNILYFPNGRIRKISIGLAESVAAETRETIQSDTEEKYGAPVEITVKAAEEKAGDKRDGD